MRFKKSLLLFSIASLSIFASADVMDRPKGINIGERLTIRPYVSLSFTYDSNPDMSKHSTKTGSQWMVHPGFDAEYTDDNWQILGGAYYQYHAYNRYSSYLNESSYGERLSIKWTNAAGNDKGWDLSITENFRQIAADDDMSNSGGRGILRDRKEFQADGVLQRRLNSRMRAAALANYYSVDYANNAKKYGYLYSWSRASTGLEFGYAPSRWLDFIIQGMYQWYWQDNQNRDVSYTPSRYIRSDSSGYSLMGGIGSRATEKISYRALGGWSCFKYGEGTSTMNGFTYQLSANWQYSSTTHFMILGSSYYQPSERYYGSAMKVNTVSAGLGKSFIRGKLQGTLDFAMRYETTEYTMYSAYNQDELIWSARIGLSYTINRFMGVFGRVEYQSEETSGSTSAVRRGYYDYDRVRATIGIKLTY